MPSNSQGDVSAVDLSPDHVASGLLEQADALVKEGRKDDALALFDEGAAMCDRLTARSARELISRALSGKSRLLRELGRLEERRRVLEELVARFATDPDPSLRERGASARLALAPYLSRAGNTAGALQATNECLDDYANDPACSRVLARGMALKAGFLNKLDSPLDALEAIREVIDRFGDSEDEPTRQIVAAATYEQGVFLARLGRHNEAVSAFDQSLQTFGERSKITSLALIEKARSLQALDRPEEAMSLCGELVARYGDHTDPKVQIRVANAMLLHESMLERSDQDEERLALLNELVARLSEADDPKLRVAAANAVLRKAAILRSLKRTPEALAALDGLLARLKDTSLPGRRLLGVQTFIERAQTLKELGRFEDALESLDVAVERYSDEQETSVSQEVANALAAKYAWLIATDPTEALTTIDELLARYSDSDAPVMRRTVLFALLFKARLLLQNDRRDEAAILSDALAQRLQAEWDPTDLAVIARSLLTAVSEFAEAEQFEGALAISQGLISRLQEETDPQLVQAMIQAIQNAGHALLQLGRIEEAVKLGEWMVHFGDRTISAIDQWIKSSERASTPQERKAHLGALLTKAGVLGALDRTDEAISVLDRLIKLYQGDETDPIEGLVIAARDLREALAESDTA